MHLSEDQRARTYLVSSSASNLKGYPKPTTGYKGFSSMDVASCRKCSVQSVWFVLVNPQRRLRLFVVWYSFDSIRKQLCQKAFQFVIETLMRCTDLGGTQKVYIVLLFSMSRKEDRLQPRPKDKK